MTANTLIKIMCALWVAAVAAGFVHADAAAPSGTGFARGFNVIYIWLVWQALGVFLALAAFLTWLIARRRLSGVSLWIGPVPIIITALVFAYATFLR